MPLEAPFERTPARSPLPLIVSAVKAMGAWLPRLEAGMRSDRTAFVLRTLLAVALALYAALYLQLSSPGSAGVTALIVANMSRGGLLSKGLWRILGTLSGAIATLVMFAWFAQSPLLFLAVLSLWLGVCVFMAGTLQHFRSYGAVLAGYTVAIITAGGLTDPGNVLQYALSRLAVVSIGVISATFVSMVFQSGASFEGVVADFRKALGQIMAGLGQSGEAEGQDDAATIAFLDRLDGGIEFSGMESPDVSRRAGSLRRGVAALYAAFLSVPVVRASLRSLKAAAASEDDETLRVWLAQVDAALEATTDRQTPDPRALKQIAAGMLAAADHGAAVLRMAASRSHLADVVRVQRELEILGAAIGHFIDDARQDEWSDPRRPLRVFKDYPEARRNAVRTMVATWLAGLFCYFTGWTQSGACLGTVASLCSLMSSAPDTSAASVEFTKGTVLSSIAAYACEFVILPHVDGFPLLFLAMAPFLAAGCYALTIPRLNGRAFGFVVLFITQLTIANTMKFDALAFFNAAQAYLISGIITVMVFRVLLPVDPAREVRRFVGYLRESSANYVRKTVRGQASDDWLGWVVTLNQVARLALGRLRQSEPGRVSRLVRDSGALVLLTFEVVRIRHLIQRDELAEPEASLCERALAALDGRRSGPDAAACLTEAVERLLSRQAPTERFGRGAMAAASGLQSILLLLPTAEQLFSGEGGAATGMREGA